MSIFAWLLVGLIAGVLAKLLMPGRGPGGIIVTILLGIRGAIVGGFIAVALGVSDAVNNFRYRHDLPGGSRRHAPALRLSDG